LYIDERHHPSMVCIYIYENTVAGILFNYNFFSLLLVGGDTRQHVSQQTLQRSLRTFGRVEKPRQSAATTTIIIIINLALAGGASQAGVVVALDKSVVVVFIIVVVVVVVVAHQSCCGARRRISIDARNAPNQCGCHQRKHRSHQHSTRKTRSKHHRVYSTGDISYVVDGSSVAVTNGPAANATTN
jgi:hypothetical protein